MTSGLVQAWTTGVDAAGFTGLDATEVRTGASVASLCGGTATIGGRLLASSFVWPGGNASAQIAITALTMPAIQEAFSSGERFIVGVRWYGYEA